MTISEKPDCPEKKWKQAGDETYCICKLDDKFCLDEYGYSCEYKQEYLEEYLAEAEEHHQSAFGLLKTKWKC